jgi:threonine/homoserine/homoserine lactone efflux protein
MIELPTLTLFLATTVVIGLTPGPVIVYVIARSLQGGSRYGVLSALGAFVGCFVHIAAATLGFSALVMQSVIAFNVLKYLGAAYLVYLGIRTLLERDSHNTAHLDHTVEQIFENLPDIEVIQAHYAFNTDTPSRRAG